MVVLVGTVDAAGGPDVAPKHMATPLGWDGRVLRVGDAGYGPIAFHQEEAERVAAFALSSGTGASQGPTDP